MEYIIKLASERKKEAKHILSDLGLIRKWEQFGRPVIVGAFSYDLMLDPDIDMEIYCPDLRIEDGFQVLSECALNPRVTKARFSNELNKSDKALYWQLRYKYEDDIEWKIDMWSADNNYNLPRSEDLIQPMRDSLTQETRQAILALKNKRKEDASLICPSIDLYRAVLTDGVRTSEELCSWLGNNKTGCLTDWKPV